MVLQTRLSRRRALAGAAALAITPTLGRVLPVRATDASVTTDARGVFLNPAFVHAVEITFEQADYDALIEAYQSAGDKEWMEATVAIDGVSYARAGMRLKGNSSLMGLGGGGDRRGGGPATGGENAMDMPESLPWLIRLNKFVEGQKHEDLERFVIRSNNSATSLNEAVALDLLSAAGLDSQRAAYVAFAVNGSDPTLRLAIEEPANEWLEAHFPDGGPLFKSEASGDWSFRGTEPEDYIDVFDLEAGESGDDAADFACLTSFLEFVNNADDDTFSVELGMRLDLEKFANYLAMMDLIQNTDDIDGPGNNSYLFFDAASSQATVVPWDMNLAFGGMMGMGMNERGELPEGGFPGSFTPDGSEATPSADQAFPDVPMDGETEVGTIPSRPQNGQFPEGGMVQGGMAGGMMGGRSNPLVQRFTADAGYAAQYADATTALRASLYASGTADGLIDQWVSVLRGAAAALVDTETITSEAEAIRSVIAGA